MITFTFKGINSEDMGVHVETQPPLSTPEMRVLLFNIDGQIGTQTARVGRQAYTEEISLIIEGFENLEKVRGWLTGEGKFTRSDLPNRYRTVAFNKAMDYEHVHFSDGGLYQATLEITVLNPYWIEESVTEYTYPTVPLGTYVVGVENKGTAPSFPTIKLTKIGTSNVARLSSYFLAISYTFPYGEDEVDIDLNTQTATYKGDPRDRFLTLVPAGDTGIRKTTGIIYEWDTPVQTPNYLMKSYFIGDRTLQDFEIVTILIKGKLGSDRTGFNPYNSGGNAGMTGLRLTPDTEVSPGYYLKTGAWRTTGGGQTFPNNYLNIYQFPNTGTSTSLIEEIVVKRGELTLEEMLEDTQPIYTETKSPRLEVGTNFFVRVEGDFKIQVTNKDAWF